MKRDQSVEIQLVGADGERLPLSNVIVAIQFFTKGNHRYAFKVGRTNDVGHLRVSYDDVESLRCKNAEENLMDYNTKLEDCDQNIRVVIPSEQELREQYDNAMRLYETPPDWAKRWPANGHLAAQEIPADLTGQTTHVEIRSQQAS